MLPIKLPLSLFQALGFRKAPPGPAEDGTFEAGPMGRPPREIDFQRKYQDAESFTNHLPWLEYDPDSGMFLLDDGRSLGRLYEVRPVGVEARPEAWTLELRDKLAAVLTGSVPEEEPPWVVQFFVQDEPDLSGLAGEVAAKIPEGLRDTPFARAWLSTLAEHFGKVARPGGLFLDDLVTGGPWRGLRRRIRMTLFRRSRKPLREAQADLEHAAERLVSGLESAGVALTPLAGKDLYEWMLAWFNPNPALADGEVGKLLSLAPWPGDDPQDRPFGYDLAGLLVLSKPRYHPVEGIWYFDHLPHRAVSVAGLSHPPKTGQLFAERRIGKHLHAVFDRLPEGTIASFTVVFEPQDAVRHRLSRVEKASFGAYAEAKLAQEGAREAQLQIARGNKLYPTQVVFYLKGKDKADLRERASVLHAQLLANHLTPCDERYDLVALDTYLKALPMAFDFQYDRRRLKRARFVFSRHLAALLPLYGRSTGTGSPGFLLWNRGGEPLFFDPIRDRSANAHTLILGPTGSGKSSLLVHVLLQMMAAHRPRLFIIDGASSFRLLCDHFERLGLSVHRVVIQPGVDVSLPPFADIVRLLDPRRYRRLDLSLRRPQDLNEDPADDFDDADEERDYLGEAEIACRLMITGGDPQEERRLTRADRMVLREAIVEAARRCRTCGRQPRTRDVAAAIRDLAGRPDLDPTRRARVGELADALSLFTTEGSLEAHLFDREGTLWPEVDVTLLEMGILSREGYEDKLTVAYLSLMNHIHALVEKKQYEGRPTLVLTDEAHLITTNPLLSPYLAKISKMWRRYGAWLWLATQNLQDFPDQAKRILNMMEWWICLSMPPEEAQQVARFRELSEEERALLLAATKLAGRYTEGVVLSRALKALFRNVPPPLALALAQTEQSEKAHRMEILRRRRCSELEAAYAVAEEIEQARMEVL